MIQEITTQEVTMIEYHVLNMLEDLIVEASGLAKDDIHAIGIEMELDGTLVCWVDRHSVLTTHRDWLGRVTTETSYQDPSVKVTLTQILAVHAKQRAERKAYIDSIREDNRATANLPHDPVSPEDNER